MAEEKSHPPSSILHPRPFLIAGPTASGKSEIALLLAEKIGGEIISVDSMQVYRGLDIGTAKPSAEERARVKHHLIDVADLNEAFDAARFVALARAAMREIQARQRTPILCGGTGLYFKALLAGLGSAPPSDAALREELEALPLESLLAELAERDPVTFGKIDRQNPRRVVRAVEVIRLTGRPFSAQRSDWQTSGSASEFCSIGIARRSEELKARIDRRVEAMFAAGLVDETRHLLERGLEKNRTAMQALGYRQVVEHLRGERSLAETIELVKARTRQFAKRQMTWFRRQATLEWLEVDADQTTAEIVSRISSFQTRA
ncbi:MAG: tRNA (adenosine(37)-N6)-dimethylallyltransferase MiaA [Verrucomicrobia bacterium]|nr:MAG: tRNA (adenosine(37)-N6)-dimethylallyltransferase MiaA [Verrucomicrobiota bacterium]